MISKEVIIENMNQYKKWGEQSHHPYKWLSILMKEVGETFKAVLENESKEYRDELLQVAAVAIAMVECHDRSLFKKQIKTKNG